MNYTWQDIANPEFRDGGFGNQERMLSRCTDGKFTAEIWENIEYENADPDITWLIFENDAPDYADNPFNYVYDASGVGYGLTIETAKRAAEQALKEANN